MRQQGEIEIFETRQGEGEVLALLLRGARIVEDGGELCPVAYLSPDEARQLCASLLVEAERITPADGDQP